MAVLREAVEAACRHTSTDKLRVYLTPNQKGHISVVTIGSYGVHLDQEQVTELIAYLEGIEWQR